MIVRKTATFQSRKGFAQVAVLEDAFEGEFFLAQRQAPTLREIYRTALSGVHIVDMFSGSEAALRSFERRCRDLTARGWEPARAA